MTRQSRWRVFNDFKLLRIFIAGRLLVSKSRLCGMVLKTGGRPRERPGSSQVAGTFRAVQRLSRDAGGFRIAVCRTDPCRNGPQGRLRYRGRARWKPDFAEGRASARRGVAAGVEAGARPPPRPFDRFRAVRAGILLRRMDGPARNRLRADGL